MHAVSCILGCFPKAYSEYFGRYNNRYKHTMKAVQYTVCMHV